jgi:hypothetical protein
MPDDEAQAGILAFGCGVFGDKQELPKGRSGAQHPVRR